MDGCERRRRRRIRRATRTMTTSVCCAVMACLVCGIRGVTGNSRVGRAPGPTAAPECALIPDPGNCQGFFRRFYYDRWTGRCAMFIYSGCKGVVPFLIHKQCEEAKCYLMFPERNLQSSNAFFRQSSADDGAEFHVSTVRATAVIV